MIRGAVNARLEAVVRLRLRGPSHPGLDVDAVVDSGFTEALTSPAAMVATLGLAAHSTGRMLLADGSSRPFAIHEAEIAWDGGWRKALTYAMGADALIGMRLLAGHELRVAVVPGGAVEISPLPWSTE